MSVILATAEYMLSDKRITADARICRPCVKARKNPYMVAGGVGDYCCILAVCSLVRDGASHPSDLADVLTDDSEAICIYQSKIWLVRASGVSVVGDKFFAVGSGGGEVNGYLSALKRWDPKTAREAFRTTFRYNPCCGDGMTLLRA